MNAQTTDTLERLNAHAPVWRQWRCVCGTFLMEYDATRPCHIRRKCAKCKRENLLDIQGVEK